MSLTAPLPYTEAIDKLDSKPLLRSELNAQEMLEHTSAERRERSFFSSRVISARILQEFKNSAMAIVAGQSDKATQRYRLQQLRNQLGYQAEPGKEGSLQDLFSNARIDVMLKMNISLVRNFGAWQQGNTPGALLAFPAQELIRVANRVKKRAWVQRWNDARETLGDATTATEAVGSEEDDADGINAFALKNDPIWPALSRFGLPYPPFDYESGMGLRDVDYRSTVALGLMDPGDKPLQPKPRKMNDGLQASVDGLDDEFTEALLSDLSDEVELAGGVLRFKNELSRGRCQAVFALLNSEGEKDISQVPQAFALRDRGQAVLRFLQEESWT